MAQFITLPITADGEDARFRVDEIAAWGMTSDTAFVFHFVGGKTATITVGDDNQSQVLAVKQAIEKAVELAKAPYHEDRHSTVQIEFSTAGAAASMADIT